MTLLNNIVIFLSLFHFDYIGLPKKNVFIP